MSEEINSENIERIVNHWIKSSDEDFNVMASMHEKEYYNWALFVGHLCLEKLLKAIYIRKFGQHPPFTHNLYRLAELNEMDLSDDNRTKNLFEITAFNLNARYGDYKKNFYARCTAGYTNKWIAIIKEMREWIKEKL